MAMRLIKNVRCISDIFESATLKKRFVEKLRLAKVEMQFELTSFSKLRLLNFSASKSLDKRQHLHLNAYFCVYFKAKLRLNAVWCALAQ